MAEQPPGRLGCGRLILFSLAGALIASLCFGTLVTLTPSEEAETFGQALGAGVVLGALVSPIGAVFGAALGLIAGGLDALLPPAADPGDAISTRQRWQHFRQSEAARPIRRSLLWGGLGGSLIGFNLILAAIAFVAMMGSMPSFSGWTPFPQTFSYYFWDGIVWYLAIAVGLCGIPLSIFAALFPAFIIPQFRNWQARQNQQG